MEGMQVLQKMKRHWREENDPKPVLRGHSNIVLESFPGPQTHDYLQSGPVGEWGGGGGWWWWWWEGGAATYPHYGSYRLCLQSTSVGGRLVRPPISTFHT